MISKLKLYANGIPFLYQNVSNLDLNRLNGKRIAIVGPASTVYDKQNGEEIDEYDEVVRINKGIHLLKDPSLFPSIGKRTTILYHSFFEQMTKGGGGVLDLPFFRECGLEYLVCPRPTWEATKKIIRFYGKYQESFPTYRLSSQVYSQVTRGFGTIKPSNGYCAIASIIQADFSELYITGFTFMLTPYGKGYRDDLQGVKDVKLLPLKHGGHDYGLELIGFKRLLKENAHKNIILDAGLADVIEQY